MRSLFLTALAVTLSLLVFSTPTPARAHSVPVQSSVTPGSLIPELPSTFSLRFSEGVTLSLSSLHITGPHAVYASYGALQSGNDGRSLITRLQTQGGGTYTVSWDAVSSEDGQVSAGSFYFAVGYVSQAGDLQTQAPIREGGALRVTEWLGAFTNWLLLLVAILWAGGVLFELPPGTAVARPATAGEDSWLVLVADRSRALRNRLLEILLGLLAFSWLLEAARLTFAGRASLLGAIVSLFFSGQLGFLRLLLLAAPVLALLDLRRPSVPVTPVAGTRRGRTQIAVTSSRFWAVLGRLPAAGRWGHCITATLFLFGLAASSHAAGVQDITLSAVVLAWLHDLGAAAWIGALTYLTLVVLPAAEDLDLDRRAPLMLGLLRRLVPFIVCSVLILAVSGLFAAQLAVGNARQLVGTRYGDVLDLKTVLVALAFLLSLYLVGPLRARLDALWNQRQRLETLHVLQVIGRIQRLISVVGVIVLGATAVLTFSVPSSVPLLSAAALPGSLTSAAWHSVGLSNLTVYRLQFDPQNRHILWAATNKGVWRSTDDQQSWTQRGTILKKLTIYDLLFLDGDHGILAAGSDGHLYRTYDAGAHWQKLGNPFGTHPLRALAGNGHILLAAGADGIFRSSDDSRHWHLVHSATSPGISSLLWSTSSNQFLAGQQSGPWQIYGAGADGASWSPLPNAPGVPSGVTTLGQTSGSTPRIFVGTSGNGPWASETPQSPWRAVRVGLTSSTAIAAVQPDTRTTGLLYLATALNGIYVSQDGGASWTPLGQNIPLITFSLAMRSGSVRILYAGTATGIYTLTIG